MSGLGVRRGSAEHLPAVHVWRIEEIGCTPVDCRIGLIRTHAGSSSAEKRQQVQRLQARLLAGASGFSQRSRLSAVSRSYAAEFGVCAVAYLPRDDEPTIRIGVDIEQDPGAAQFSAAELCSVSGRMGLPFGAASPRQHFFATWTEYEARAKALGTGLGLTLEETRRFSSTYHIMDLYPLWERCSDLGATAPLYGALCLSTLDGPRRRH